MTEKQFFHLVLQKKLINGSHLKQKLDASLKRAPAGDASSEAGGSRAARIAKWVSVPAAAVLLILTLAIGAIVASRGLQDTQTHTERPWAEATSAPVDPSTPPAVVIEPKIRTMTARIKLLPEFDPEHLIDQMRINHHGLSAFSEADWKWLREADVQVNALSIKGDCVYWTVELRLMKGDRAENPFLSAVEVMRNEMRCLYTDADGNLREDPRAELVCLASPGEVSCGEDGDAWLVRVPFVCPMPRSEWCTGDLTAQCILLLLDPRLTHGDESYVSMVRVDETTGERTYLLGHNEALPDATVGAIELSFVFVEDPWPVKAAEQFGEAALCTVWKLAGLEAADGSDGDANALGLEQYLVFRTDGTVRMIDCNEPSDRTVPYTLNGRTVRFDDRVLRYDLETNDLLWIDPVTQDIYSYVPAPNAVLPPEAKTPEPGISVSPEPSDASTPAAEPESSHEDMPQVYENGEKVYDGFSDTVLFRDDWDLSGEPCEIRLAVDREQFTVTVTDGRRTSEPIHPNIDLKYNGLQRAILLDLDPDTPYRDLVLVILGEEDTYFTIVMHPDGDRIAVTKRLIGECIWDGTSLIMNEWTALLGDGSGWRRYSGEELTPESDWLVCESPNSIALDHVAWLKTVRDLPCAIDGKPAVIEGGTLLYRTRFNNDAGLVEVCTEDGTIAQITFDDPDLCTIDGVYQEEYFEYLPLSD